MSKSYFEKIIQEDGSYIGRVYLLRVENPPTVVLEPGGLIAEFFGDEEAVDTVIALETAKLEK